MTRKTIDCVECGESVPYGRLSCSACGALLASVSGARGPAHAPTPAVPARPLAPAAVVETLARPEAATRMTVRSPWPPLADRPEPMLSPRPYGQPGNVRPTDRSDAWDRSAPPPGAYRPPTLVLAAAGNGVTGMRGPGARLLAGGVGSVTARKVAPTTDPSAPDHPEVAHQTRFMEIADWFVVVGASLSALGFLLPWSVTVIGSSGFGGYFDDWGLASPTHMLILIGLLVVLALGVLQTPVPAWFGTGVLGLLLGGLLLGVAWPYVVGRLGAEVGVVIVGLGGLALVIGGALAIRSTRHAGADPLV